MTTATQNATYPTCSPLDLGTTTLKNRTLMGSMHPGWRRSERPAR